MRVRSLRAPTRATGTRRRTSFPLVVALLASVLVAGDPGAPPSAASTQLLANGPKVTVSPGYVPDDENPQWWPYTVESPQRVWAGGLPPSTSVYLQQCQSNPAPGDYHHVSGVDVGEPIRCEEFGGYFDMATFLWVSEPIPYQVDESGVLDVVAQYTNSYAGLQFVYNLGTHWPLEGLAPISDSGDCASTGLPDCWVRIVTPSGVPLAATKVPFACYSDPPFAGLTITPASGDAPLTVTADASTSGAQGVCASPIESYTFNFGDGTVLGPQASPIATHTFTEPEAEFLVTVTVRNKNGQYAVTSKLVATSSPDLDGDGILDDQDNCIGHANPDQADGDGDGSGDPCDEWPQCESNDELTCEGSPPPPPPPPPPVGEDPKCGPEVAARGYTTAHYDADLNLAAMRDPDFFDWDVSATWCVQDGRVQFRSADSTGTVTLDDDIQGALALIGVGVRNDSAASENYVVATEGTTGTVTASTDFDVCFNPLTLITAGAGSYISTASAKLAKIALGKMPKTGERIDEWSRAFVDRVHAVGLEIELQITRRVEDLLSSPTFRALPQAWRTAILQTVRNWRVDLDSLVEFGMRSTQTFYDVYAGGGATVNIPRADKAAALKRWESIVGDVASELPGQLARMLDKAFELEVCTTVWRPILVIYIPAAGRSFVDDGGVDASILDVKGGILVDTRP